MLGSIDGDEFAMINDGETVAKGLSFFEIVGGDQDGSALFPEGEDVVPDGTARLYIDAQGWFVKVDQLWK
jgi:hypothetical protein